MTPEQAAERLARMTNASAEPVLSVDDLADLLGRARRPDLNGRLPDDVLWLPTYDLNAAAGAGWRLKAAQLAGTSRLTSMAADGASFGKNDTYREALEMAAYYEAQARGPLDIDPNEPGPPPDIGSVPVVTTRRHRLDQSGTFPDGCYPVANW